jgi:hypothetical protein
MVPPAGVRLFGVVEAVTLALEAGSGRSPTETTRARVHAASASSESAAKRLPTRLMVL